jgi:hypothetical protein
MGPAAVLKTVVGARFSLTVFGLSQVLIDLEPLIRICRGDPFLHRTTHHLAGALLIAALAAEPGRRLCQRLIPPRLEDRRGAIADGVDQTLIPRGVAWGSALLGTLSHLVLDGVMHDDVQPFWLLSDAQPWLHAIPITALHAGCIGLGVLGLAGLASRYAFRA